jgi:protein O-mannosyl-transferase
MAPGNPMPYHILQLLLAIANGLLVFAFLRRYMNEAVALAVSLAYLAHPLNAEIVVYIADLQDTLYTFFGLLALNFIANSKGFGWKRAAGFSALLLCSFLSKETGILYFVTAIVFAAVFRRDLWKRVAAASCTSLAIYLYLRIFVAHLTALTYSQNQIGRASFETRLLTAPAVLASYLWKFIFPRDITGTQDWVINEITWQSFWLPLIFALAVLVASIWYAWRYWKNGRGDLRFAFFTFWVFMGMGFHSHIIVSLDGTVADRWFYFSSIGLFAMIGLVLDRVAAVSSTRWARPLAYGCLALIAALGVRSSIRGVDWYDNYTVCLHDLQIFPDSYDMHNNLGVEYFRRGKIPEAKAEFEKSVALAPGWDINWNNLGAAYNRQGDVKKAQESYLKAMEHGTYYMAYENYAATLVAQGRYDEAKRFIAERALPMFPASRELLGLERLLNSK